MKVIHILNELKFSGAEIMYVDAAPIFQQKGYELTVLATAKKLGEYAPYFQRAGYKILQKEYPPFNKYLSRIKYYFEFIQLLKKENFEIVHIHANGTMWGMALCAWVSGKRSIYTFHNVFPSHFYSYHYHILLRWTAKNIFKCRFQTISDSVYQHELKYYFNKTIKIYNWYGNNRYFPASEEEKIKSRKDLDIDINSFVIISIGGCSPIKRHSDIINALPQIIEKIPKCLYLHLGEGISEPEEIELAKEIGIENHIRFCGNQVDVRKYLISSDVYLMSSRFEGISLTTIEAMACQIPAILYDVPGLRDFNKEGENCVLIPEDFHILAEKVISLKTDHKKAEELALRANNFVITKFSMATNVEEICKLYTK